MQIVRLHFRKYLRTLHKYLQRRSAICDAAKVCVRDADFHCESDSNSFNSGMIFFAKFVLLQTSKIEHDAWN